MKRDFYDTLKPRISQLLTMGRGYARINNISTLAYLTEDCFGRPCDDLTLIFDHISGIPSKGYPISARTYKGIIEQIQECTALYLLDVADCVILDLDEGIASC